MSGTRLGRREFCLAAAFAIGRPPRARAELPPTPRVARLESWRDVPELSRLRKAFDFLESAELEGRDPGRYPLDSERMYLTIAAGATRAPLSGRFESHRKYVDIHLLIRGEEMIGAAAASDLVEAEPYAPEGDAELFEVPRTYRKLLLEPGDFAVFFPGQAHLPGCHADRPWELKKAVVKVLASTL